MLRGAANRYDRFSIEAIDFAALKAVTSQAAGSDPRNDS